MLGAVSTFGIGERIWIRGGQLVQIKSCISAGSITSALPSVAQFVGSCPAPVEESPSATIFLRAWRGETVSAGIIPNRGRTTRCGHDETQASPQRRERRFSAAKVSEQCR